MDKELDPVLISEAKEATIEELSDCLRIVIAELKSRGDAAASIPISIMQEFAIAPAILGGIEKKNLESPPPTETPTENLWSYKYAAVEAFRIWGFEEEFNLAIWSSGRDRRVYLQSSDYSYGRRSSTGWKFCCYVTGNEFHPPGSLEGEGRDCWLDDKQELLAKLLIAISTDWKGDIKISSSHRNGLKARQKILAKYLEIIKGDKNVKE